MSGLTLGQRLALAVLQGDEDSLLPLLDALIEQYGMGERPVRLPPINQIKVNHDRLRMVAFLKDDVAFVHDGPAEKKMVMMMGKWLRGEIGPVILSGIDRIELYEVGEPSNLEVKEIK